MFRRALPLLARNLPSVMKLGAFTLSCLLIKTHTNLIAPTKCLNFPVFSKNIIAQTLQKIIRIQQNGQIVGYAYCFDERMLVSTSHELFDKKARIDQYDFFLGDTKIQCSFKVLGKYQHLTFIQAANNIIPVLPGKQTQLYSEVQVVQSRTYPSIYNGYYVANDSGFGIINGKGEFGSLVLNFDGVVGIVSKVGRDADEGFLRILLWKDIKNLARRLQNHKQSNLYLGMSVVSSETKNGISIVRVAPNSPLSNYIKMGDTVTKVNNCNVKNADDLVRIIMFSDKRISFEIEDQENNKKIITVQL